MTNNCFKQSILSIALLASSSLYAQDTELNLFRPFGKAAPQSDATSKAIEGECWQQSQRIKREDAWRCNANGAVHDPCFIKQYGDHRQALCAQAPWDSSTVLLNLANPADNTQHLELDMSQTYPWAVELQNGEKCLSVDEGSTADGLPIHYQCNNQAQLIGHLQRCKTEWTMLRRSGNGQVETVPIARVWF